jgi:hypothetical protein
MYLDRPMNLRHHSPVSPGSADPDRPPILPLPPFLPIPPPCLPVFHCTGIDVKAITANFQPEGSRTSVK